jgi:sugar phosphate isomerase/epimerase
MFDESPELLADVADNLGQVDNFGVCFDIAHAYLSNVPLDTWTGALSPNIKHIHINDNDKLQDLHLAVGSGQIDWSILKNKELFAASPSLLIEVNGMDRLLSSYQFLESINFFE